MSQTVTRRTLGVSLAALAAASSTLARAAAPASAKPLYKDPTQSIELRVRDLLSRMTLEEKAAQLIGIWLTKAKIQTPEGEFDGRRGQQELPATAWARSPARPTIARA
jgi:beta-glucosidase